MSSEDFRRQYGFATEQHEDCFWKFIDHLEENYNFSYCLQLFWPKAANQYGGINTPTFKVWFQMKMQNDSRFLNEIGKALQFSKSTYVMLYNVISESCWAYLFRNQIVASVKKVCYMCLDNPVEHVLKPCRHIKLCQPCHQNFCLSEEIVCFSCGCSVVKHASSPLNF